MDEEERQTRDNRRWHVTKEVPLALIVTIILAIFAAGGAWMANTNKNTAQDERIETILIDLRDMRKQWQEGSIPSAQNAWKIQLNEAAVLEIKSRMLDAERRGAEREVRILRLENALNATNARARARDER